MGENPCLWKKFHLKVLVDMYDQHCRPSSPSSSSSSSSSPTDGDDEGEYHQPFNQQKLLQVLSLGRLRSLQELSLKIDADTFFMVWTKSINTNKWKDSADLLHKIRDRHPNIKKLGLELTTYECEDQRERRGCIGTRAHNLCHDNRQLIVIAINCNHSASKINCN